MTSEKLCTQSPGPVYYPASSTYKNTFASPSHSFGASHRYMLSAQKQATAAVPGPGMYQTSGAVGTQRDSSKHSYSSWGFGTSTRADMAKVFVSPQHAKTESGFIDSPGPAAYSFGGTFGRQSDSRRSSSQSFGMGTSDRFFDRIHHGSPVGQLSSSMCQTKQLREQIDEVADLYKAWQIEKEERKQRQKK